MQGGKRGLVMNIGRFCKRIGARFAEFVWCVAREQYARVSAVVCLHAWWWRATYIALFVWCLACFVAYDSRTHRATKTHANTHATFVHAHRTNIQLLVSRSHVVKASCETGRARPLEKISLSNSALVPLALPPPLPAKIYPFAHTHWSPSQSQESCPP